MFPETSLIQAGGGIYGATRSGGLIPEGFSCGLFNGCGVAFRIPLSGGPYTLLHAFTDSEGSQVQTLIHEVLIYQVTRGMALGTCGSALGGGKSARPASMNRWCHSCVDSTPTSLPNPYGRAPVSAITGVAHSPASGARRGACGSLR